MKRTRAIKFDSFASNGKTWTLWIMPSSMQIVVEENGRISENITLKSQHLQPLQLIDRYRELAASAGTQDALKKIDCVENCEQDVSLWLASDDSLHLLVTNENEVVQYLSSKETSYDDARIALRFEELKSELSGEDVISQAIEDFEYEQLTLFMEGGELR